LILRALILDHGHESSEMQCEGIRITQQSCGGQQVLSIPVMFRLQLQKTALSLESAEEELSPV
jgi:hypothetical protein